MGCMHTFSAMIAVQVGLVIQQQRPQLPDVLHSSHMRLRGSSLATALSQQVFFFAAPVCLLLCTAPLCLSHGYYRLNEKPLSAFGEK